MQLFRLRQAKKNVVAKPDLAYATVAPKLTLQERASKRKTDAIAKTGSLKTKEEDMLDRMARMATLLQHEIDNTE